MKKILLLLITFTSLTHAFTPYEPMTAWNIKTIKVCWGTEAHRKATFAITDKREFIPYTADQKEWIKDIITKEFTLSETGIEFSGWNNCEPKAEGSEVVLLRVEPAIPDDAGFIFAESGGRATIGQRGNPVEHHTGTSLGSYTTYEKSNLPYLNFVILNTRSDDKRMPPNEYIKMIALHEFGHTAGLRHQHVRIKDVKQDLNCKKVPEIKISEEPAFASTKFAGPYDHNSIMNYCYINVLSSKTGLSFRAKSITEKIILSDDTLFTATPSRNRKKHDYVIRVGLSAQDKHSLRCMYVYDEATKEKQCSFSK